MHWLQENFYATPKFSKNLPISWEHRDGAVVRALASHQCGPGSNPGFDAICGLILLLFLSFAPKGFSPRTPVFLSRQKPTFPNSTRNQVDEEPLCGNAISKSSSSSSLLLLNSVMSFDCSFPLGLPVVDSPWDLVGCS